jgi:predicted MPP superfamily phosphohydrolase
MNAENLSVIISPNLGCPLIVSLEEIQNDDQKSIQLILAMQSAKGTGPGLGMLQGKLFLTPSYQGDMHPSEIPLAPTENPVEITDWNVLSNFTEADDTRRLINNELHYNILGPNTRYWVLNVRVEMERNQLLDLLRSSNGKRVPTLYDLVHYGEAGTSRSVNRHAIQFVDTFKSACDFIHLTDLHLAARNDEMLDEVLKVKHTRSRDEIRKSYINFNDQFRTFIRLANRRADEGKLDFIVITGDLLDFAFRGWVPAANDAENNWKTFINILTGQGAQEKTKGNPGLKVAAFTSTGNHDWRMYPYDPNLRETRHQFGLEWRELKNYNYKAFDAREHPDHERVKETEKLIRKQFGRFNLDHFDDKLFLQLAKMLMEGPAGWALPPLAAALGLTGARAAGVAQQWSGLVRSGVYGLIGLGVGVVTKALFDSIMEKWLHLLAGDPLHADAKSLHYYLRHINPYFDYAFTYGDHSFVVMDTGPDACVAPLQDGKTLESIKIMTYSKSILSGSPDSRAFDSEHIHYNWSQIVWLEKVLEAVNPRTKRMGRTFVFVHSPPINFRTTLKCSKENLWESRRTGKKHRWIPQQECVLTFGTINHFLSQFWYMCLGFVESDLVGSDPVQRFNKVDVVFSGHTHRNFEFRMSLENNGHIRIFADPYSRKLDRLIASNTEKGDSWWKANRPIVVQTAACGPRKFQNQRPPYFRPVSIDENGAINSFTSYNCSEESIGDQGN